VGPRDGVDYVEERIFLTLPGLELRPIDRPARSQSQYRLPALKHTFSTEINQNTVTNLVTRRWVLIGIYIYIKVKISLLQAVEAHRVARG
jgi:hypothetical protein